MLAVLPTVGHTGAAATGRSGTLSKEKPPQLETADDRAAREMAQAFSAEWESIQRDTP